MMFQASLTHAVKDLDWSKYLDGIVAASAIVSSIVGITKNISERGHNRSSLLSKREKELDRASKLAASYAHLSQASLSQHDLQLLLEGIQSRLQECVTNIKDLNQKLAEGEDDSNWKLNTWKRIFLWFKPLGWREFVPHVLAYLCLLSIFWWVYQGVVADDKDQRLLFSMLTAIAIAFTFIFRSWSLDVRRREFGYRRKVGKITRFLLVQAPENLRMLAGQFFFFFSVTVSSVLLITAGFYLSKYFNAALQGSDRSGEALNVFMFSFLFMFVSLYTSIFHAWAIAEYKWASIPAKLLPLRFRIFRHAFGHLRRYHWKLIKCILAVIFGAFYIAFACFGIVVMLMDPKERDWLGAGLATGALIFGICSIYAANRVMKIYYSIDLRQAGEPLKGAAAAGD